MRNAEPVDLPGLVCPTCGAPLDLDRLNPSPTIGPQIDLAIDSRVAADLRLAAVEREIVDLLLQGYRVVQIAARLGATVPTVRKRVRKVLAKTGTHSQAELIASFRGS